MKLGAVLVAALACIAPAFAQTPEQQTLLSRAEVVGRDLYDHDRAAWLATDAMFAELGGPAGAQGQVRGWVTERAEDGIVVTFVAADGDESFYRAVYREGALQEQGMRRELLSLQQQRLFRARQTAMQAPVGFCSASYNTVALARPDSEIVDVYLMPGTTDPAEVIVGGYHRIAVDAAGAIVETQSFSRTCLTLRRDDPSMAGAPVSTLWFRHIQSPLPTETHVFLNLTQALPLFVSTTAGIWSVAEGRITHVENPPP